MELKEIILVSIAVAASVYGYVRYGREIPKKTLKPRPFTWLIWGILSTCVTIIQIQNDANLGTIGAALGAVSGFVLAGMAWYYGHRKIYTLDVVSLVLAGIVLAAWAFVGDAATAIAATVVYLIGFAPTFTRAWKAPHKERRTTFAMSVVKYTISFILLDSISIETAVYPVVLAVANLAFIVMLLMRRGQRS